MKDNTKSSRDILSATNGNTIGEIKLKWSQFDNVKFYEVQMINKKGARAKWKTLDITSKLTYTINVPEPGSAYYFRIACLNEDNKSLFSNKVNVKFH